MLLVLGLLRGLQRFGSGSVPSIDAGRSLLAGNHDEFVRHLFSPTRCRCRKRAL